MSSTSRLSTSTRSKSSTFSHTSRSTLSRSYAIDTDLDDVAEISEFGEAMGNPNRAPPTSLSGSKSLESSWVTLVSGPVWISFCGRCIKSGGGEYMAEASLVLFICLNSH